jgi:hypothetical protein
MIAKDWLRRTMSAGDRDWLRGLPAALLQLRLEQARGTRQRNVVLKISRGTARMIVDASEDLIAAHDKGDGR